MRTNSPPSPKIREFFCLVIILLSYEAEETGTPYSNHTESHLWQFHLNAKCFPKISAAPPPVKTI